MHELLSDDDINDISATDRDLVRSKAATSMERIEETLGIRPSTKKEVLEREEKVMNELKVVETALMSDDLTFEDKNYIQGGMKTMISLNMSVMEEIKKEIISGGGHPRLYEVLATLTSSTTMCFSQLMNVQKLAAAAIANKDDAGYNEISETVSTTRKMKMGPAEMQKFIENGGKV